MQCAVADAAVVQLKWLLPLPATLVALHPGRILTLTKTFSLVDMRISHLHFLLMNLWLVFHSH
jgi:hypothetical protein